MSKTYAVFEGVRILRMSHDKKELIEYLKSLPEAERRKMFLAERKNPQTEEGESHVKQSGKKI